MSAERDLDHLLAQDARIRRVSRMVPANGPLSDRVRTEIISTLRDFMETHDLKQSDVASAVASSSTHINNVLNSTGGMAAETRDLLLRDINNWMDREVRARENKRPHHFVDTRVAIRVHDLGERLTERADIAVAWGPAGIGKTMSAEAAAAALNATYMFIDDDCRSRFNFKRKLAAILTRRSANKNAASLDIIIEKLRQPERVSARSLLILDNAHELDPKVYKIIMAVHDLAQCSILLLGTIDLYRATSTEDGPEYGQLSSRVGMRINLARELTGKIPPGGRRKLLFNVSDLKAMFEQRKIKLHPDTLQMLLHIANSVRGTLRRVERLVYWAEKAAAKAKSSIILPIHITKASEVIGEELPLSLTEIGPDMAPAADDAGVREATA